LGNDNWFEEHGLQGIGVQVIMGLNKLKVLEKRGAFHFASLTGQGWVALPACKID